MAETFLITGSVGCIGAWTLRNLVDEGVNIIASDVSTDRSRPGLVLSEDELNDAMQWVQLDVTDGEAVRSVVADHGVTNIVHLAGLQIPFCRASPALGAMVNVVGTVNIFEAARHEAVDGLSYASSIAVMGSNDSYPDEMVGDDARLDPSSLYGVYKVANEGTARIYWNDWQVASVGLRPYNVYGVGRDQGLTSDVAKAILATAAGLPFHIRFGGDNALQHANDVAKIFISASRSGHRGAATCNLRSEVRRINEVVALLKELVPGAQLTFDEDNVLPFPSDLDESGLESIIGLIPHTPIADAVVADLDRYRALLADGRIDLGQLEK